MTKRLLLKATVAALVVLATVLLACCGPKTKRDKESVGELLGTFAGPAGRLVFLPESQVLLSLDEAALWALEGRDNERIYGYVFILGNEMVSYDEAEAFYLHDGKDTFAKIVCLTEKDRIVLRAEDREAVFERRPD